MKISYNWLKEYLDVDLPVAKASEILTNIGLEVEGIETYESVKGGLNGLVIGEVLSCEKHPNAKKLSLTTVNIGNNETLNIVCGAPNVAAGQKVVVATIGTTLYMGDESLKIKKSKIRGEESHGMICAEDEIGLGTSHEGIMVLDEDAKPGIAARDYFKIESDTIFEIGLTPNRIDAASHYGVARDLAAYLAQNEKVHLNKPNVNSFKVDKKENPIEVIVEDPERSPRYSGLCIRGLEVKDSPKWLKNRLLSIGQKPINNVVDITNFVLHELGQPLHAFDAAKIKGNKVIVKTLPEETPFVTLDGVERKLSSKDLMICNEDEGMCIGGVFGGAESGVTESTTAIFLESAHFNPVSIRKTARRHGLNTDASFRFERGTDPNLTVYALKRAALLIKEIAGGEIVSEIIDFYPKPIQDFKVKVQYKNINRLIGNNIDNETIKHILLALEIKIVDESEEGLTLLVPPYRVDVKRECDIIEEILRIYGYNFVNTNQHVSSTLSFTQSPDVHQVKNALAELLTGNGFNESMCNSLSKSAYYDGLESYPENRLVKIFNPLSQDLNVMRQTLLFGGLEAISNNIKHRNHNLKFYEFGNCYFFDPDKKAENKVQNYSEEEHISLWITGDDIQSNWYRQANPQSFYSLKSYIELFIQRSGIVKSRLKVTPFENDIFVYGLEYSLKERVVLRLGSLRRKILNPFEIEQDVFFADIHWPVFFELIKQSKISYNPISKYPAVKRDLSMILDKKHQFADLQDLAFRTDKKILKNVDIFDVYEGKNIPEGKISYALSFILQDESKTLNDKYIDKVMNSLIKAFEREFGAEIRMN